MLHWLAVACPLQLRPAFLPDGPGTLTGCRLPALCHATSMKTVTITIAVAATCLTLGLSVMYLPFSRCDGTGLAKQVEQVTPVESGPRIHELEKCVQRLGIFDQHETEMILLELQHRPDRRGQWPLVFTHIPKTGGTAVVSAIFEAWDAFGCGKINNLRDKLRIKQGRRDCYSLRLSSSGVHLFPWGVFGRSNYTAKMQPRHTIIGAAGHVSFGTCAFFGSNCSYATVLREPIERYVSHVRWECSHGTSKRRFCNTSIAEYTDAVMGQDVWFYGVDNHQTRMLSGDISKTSLGLPCVDGGCTQLGFRKVGKSDLKSAISNLVFHYPVWGVLEDLQGFSRRLEMIYGYSIAIKHMNKGTFSKINLNITEKTRKTLDNLLEADLSLYKFVKCVLESGSPRFA